MRLYEQNLEPDGEGRTIRLSSRDSLWSSSFGSKFSEDSPTVQLPGAHRQRALREGERGMSAFATPPPDSTPISGPGEGSSRVYGASPTPTAFFPGENIAGRFRVVRFIGRGGMGEVYEVEDLELRVHVAIKTVRPDIASDSKAIDRFKREINLARKVTHANVCRTFDLFHHQSLIPGVPDLHFLSMELLDGETLAARLRRQGRMTAAEALPIILQLAHGLDAAHRATIIHRDFKSQNVILVPHEGDEGVRAVITDFGLAYLAAGDQSISHQQSSRSDFVGSPPYMAPEQVEGGEVTPASDVYALGVVMYEMVCGTQPFVGDTPLSTAIKRLREAPPSPRLMTPDLDRRWESTILRCLERRPERRFANTIEIASALTGGTVPRRRFHRPFPFGLTAGVLGALVMLTATTFYNRYSSLPGQSSARTPDLSAAARPRRSVAVLGFRNRTGQRDVAYVSTAISEILTSELGAGDKLQAIPQMDVARTKRDLSLDDSDNLSSPMLSRLGANLDADYMVTGSYVDAGENGGGRIKLELRLEDTRTGVEMARLSETGDEAHLHDLGALAGRDIREKLHSGDILPADREATKAALPSDPRAARFYSEGLQKMQLFENLAARDLLEKALEIEPKHALTHSALAATYDELGNHQRAVGEAKKAVNLSANLPFQQQLQAEGQYDEAVGEWRPAVKLYEKLHGAFPDNLDYGLDLANAQMQAGEAGAALFTISGLKQLPAPAGADPRIDYRQALAAGSQGDFNLELQSSRRAIERARSAGARLLGAKSRIAEGWALENLGRPADAASAFESARTIFRDAGDTNNMAAALSDMAILNSQQGNLDEARIALEESIAAGRAAGNDLAVGKRLNNLALVLWQQGRLEEAEKSLDQALPLLRACGNPNMVARVLNDLAIVRSEQGRLTEAKASQAQAIAIFRANNDRSGKAESLDTLSEILRQQGSLEEAQANIEKALELFAQVKDSSGSSEAQNELGSILLDRGDVGKAREILERALQARDQLGERAHAAVTRMALANLSIEEERLQDAETLARTAGDVFRRQSARDNSILADVTLAKALLAERRVAEALALLERSAPLAAETTNRRVSLTFASAMAYARAAAADSRNQATLVAEGSSSLKSTIASARSLGLIGIEFEARLTLGKLEMRYGNPNAGRTRLAALEKQASAAGFGLIAHNAAMARKERAGS